MVLIVFPIVIQYTRIFEGSDVPLVSTAGPDKSCLHKMSLSFLSDMFPSIFWVMLNRMAPYHKW